MAASASTPSLSPSSPTHGLGFGGRGDGDYAVEEPIYPPGSGGFAPTPPLKVRRGQQVAPHLDDREPTIPVLPPIRPGEQFDSRRWRGTIYAENRGDGSAAGAAGAREEPPPKSATSIGTSILDSPTVGQWALR